MDQDEQQYLRRGYVAGLLEGEGTFYAGLVSRSTNPSFSITVSMVDLEPLEILQKICAGNITKRSQRYDWQIQHTWKLSQRSLVLKTCKWIYPLMSPRRKNQINKLYTHDLKYPKYYPIPDHGTYNFYVNYKCRCDLCCNAASIYRKEHKNLTKKFNKFC